jgi:polyhydroxyalkanoate synthase
MAARMRGLQEQAEKILNPRVGQTPKTLVWTKNKARLYRYDRPADAPIAIKTPFLLVYALVNRPYVLDLIPERSFVGYLVRQGIDVYLLDWGIPGPEDKEIRFDDLVMDYMPRAVRQVLKRSGTARLNLLGYCLGGVITTLYAATHPQAPLCSLVLLATPIDFEEGDLLGQWLSEQHYDVDRVVDTLGNVPADLIKGGTKLLKPYFSFAGTYQNLWENASDPKFVENWGAMNQWIEDSVPFPGEAFRQWVKEFYQSNKLVKGELELGGQRVKMTNISFPLLHIVAEEDHLVPFAQTRRTVELVGSEEKESVVMPGGHIGLVMGRKAATSLWPKVVDWLCKHDCASSSH